MFVSVDDERLNTRAIRVEVSGDLLTVELEDGRTIAVPLIWYPRLAQGTAKEWRNYEIGHWGIRWPDLDEDISIKGLLLGNKSAESPKSLSKWMAYRRRGRKVPVKTLPLPSWARNASPLKSGKPARSRPVRVK